MTFCFSQLKHIPYVNWLGFRQMSTHYYTRKNAFNLIIHVNFPKSYLLEAKWCPKPTQSPLGWNIRITMDQKVLSKTVSLPGVNFTEQGHSKVWAEGRFDFK